MTQVQEEDWYGVDREHLKVWANKIRCSDDWDDFMREWNGAHETDTVLYGYEMKFEFIFASDFEFDELEKYYSFFQNSEFQKIHQLTIQIEKEERIFTASDKELLQLLLTCKIDTLIIHSRNDDGLNNFPLEHYFPTHSHHIRQIQCLQLPIYRTVNMNPLFNSSQLTKVSFPMYGVSDFDSLSTITTVQQLVLYWTCNIINSVSHHSLKYQQQHLQKFCDHSPALQLIHISMNDERHRSFFIDYFHKYPLTVGVQVGEHDWISPHSSVKWLHESYPSKESYPLLERPSVLPLRRERLGAREDLFSYLLNPKDLICPITQQIFVNPVVAADGQTYERDAIQEYFQSNYAKIPNDLTHWKTPLTGMIVNTRDVYPNYRLKSILESILTQMTPSLEEDPLWSDEKFRSHKQRQWPNRRRRMTVRSMKKKKTKQKKSQRRYRRS
jgi:hypothetical protein